MSIKKSSIYIFVFCSVFLNFIAMIGVSWFARYVYYLNTRNVDREATMVAQAIDSLAQLPWPAYVAIGVAIGMIFMIAWSVWDTDLFKRK